MVAGMKAFTPLIVFWALKLCLADRDPNAPWGNKPPRKFRMFWKDARDVLDDIAEFDSLFIQHHGCAWSEYGIDNFDDDGEYRDGDENWYQGRTASFRANAAYSLYGVLKSSKNFGRKCTRKTYINTFFTTLGADTISDGLGLGDFGSDNDNGYGHAYCAQADDANDDSAASTTMGCSLDKPGQYIMALFSDEYCDGAYFLNTTSSEDSSNMKQYNRAMNKVTCEKVWDYSKYYTDRRLEDADDGYSSSSSTSYGSFGETLLQTSTACDLDLYGEQCPDPYGIKRKYQNAITGNVFTVRFGKAVTMPLRIVSTVALLVGIFLGSIAYYVRNKRKVRKGFKRAIRDIGKATGFVADDEEGRSPKSPTDIESPIGESPTRARSDKKKKKKKKRRKQQTEQGRSDEF